MSAPGEDGTAVGAVVVDGAADVRAAEGHVALVLVVQSVLVVLAVAEHEDAAAVLAGGEVDARLVALGEDVEIGDLTHGGAVHVAVAGVRRVEVLVEVAHEGVGTVHTAMNVNAAQLFGQGDLAHAVEVMHGGDGAPADVHGGEHVVLRPVHDVGHLVPILDLFELHLLDGRARDDDAVELLARAHGLLESEVELAQVRLRGVGGAIGRRLEQSDLHLERRVGYEAEQLQLRLFLVGHEVEQTDGERAYLLRASPALRHDEYILLFERLPRGKSAWYDDGHLILLGSLQYNTPAPDCQIYLKFACNYRRIMVKYHEKNIRQGVETT